MILKAIIFYIVGSLLLNKTNSQDAATRKALEPFFRMERVCHALHFTDTRQKLNYRRCLLENFGITDEDEEITRIGIDKFIDDNYDQLEDIAEAKKILGHCVREATGTANKERNDNFLQCLEKEILSNSLVADLSTTTAKALHE